MKQRIRRGDIIFVRNPFQVPHGHINAGNRPAVVIQNNVGNECSENLIVAYMTSKIKKLHMPTHVLLQWYGGLSMTSMVQTEQLATISAEDVIGVIDHLRDEDTARVNRALAASLALDGLDYGKGGRNYE